MFQPQFGQLGGKGNQPNSQYDFENVKPTTSYKNVVESRGNKPIGTAMKGSRPISSHKAAKFTGDMSGQSKKVELKKPDSAPDEQYKKIEREINKLIEDSAISSIKGNHVEALEKAKEAANKEKQLRRLRESTGTADLISPELAYCVTFNLANQYQNNAMYQEAINIYTTIVRNKQYLHGGRLRVNMGNIYFIQKKYMVAIKMYRMALDLIPKSSKEMRSKIKKNIGHAFVKLGNFQDAIDTYESILQESPDFATAFNLILCLYAIGDKDRLKRYFTLMLNIELPGLEEELDEELIDQETAPATSDKLKEELKEKKR